MGATEPKIIPKKNGMSWGVVFSVLIRSRFVPSPGAEGGSATREKISSVGRENTSARGDTVRNAQKLVSRDKPHPHIAFFSVRPGKIRNDVLSADLPLNRVASACGFGDYMSFYKAYIKRFGISPAAARKAR